MTTRGADGPMDGWQTGRPIVMDDSTIRIISVVDHEFSLRSWAGIRGFDSSSIPRQNTSTHGGPLGYSDNATSSEETTRLFKSTVGRLQINPPQSI